MDKFMDEFKLKSVAAYRAETTQARNRHERFELSAIQSAKVRLLGKIIETFALIDSEAQDLEIEFDTRFKFAFCFIDEIKFTVERGDYLAAWKNCPICSESDYERVFSLADVGRLVEHGFSWMSDHNCKLTSGAKL